MYACVCMGLSYMRVYMGDVYACVRACDSMTPPTTE